MPIVYASTISPHSKTSEISKAFTTQEHKKTRKESVDGLILSLENTHLSIFPSCQWCVLQVDICFIKPYCYLD